MDESPSIGARFLLGTLDVASEDGESTGMSLCSFVMGNGAGFRGAFFVPGYADSGENFTLVLP
jgi:hypothetical protein